MVPPVHPGLLAPAGDENPRGRLDVRRRDAVAVPAQPSVAHVPPALVEVVERVSRLLRRLELFRVEPPDPVDRRTRPVSEHDPPARRVLLRRACDAERLAARAEVAAGVHDVVRELGERECVAERLLERLLPVGDALHARHRTRSPRGALDLQEPRRLRDLPVRHGVGERAPDRDGRPFPVHAAVFEDVHDPELPRVRLVPVLAPDSLRVLLHAWGVRPVGHRHERPADGLSALGRARPRLGVPSDVLRGPALLLQHPPARDERLVPDLRGGHPAAAEQGEGVSRLLERPERHREARGRLRRARRHLALDAERPAEVEPDVGSSPVGVADLGPSEGREFLHRADAVDAPAATPEGDRRHDLAHVGGHVVGDGVPETSVELRDHARLPQWRWRSTQGDNRGREQDAGHLPQGEEGHQASRQRIWVEAR